MIAMAENAAPPVTDAGGPVDSGGSHSGRHGSPADDAIADDSGQNELMTGEAVALDVRPASFILRAAGALIDWLAYVLLLVGIILGILSLAGGLDSALRTALVTMSLVFCLVVVPTTVEVTSRGRSLGRWAVGARIVRDDGGAARLRHAFIRALMGVVEMFLTFGGLAALTALLNGTYSQHERVPRIVQPVYGVPVALAQWATVADVARLPDRLSRRIAAYLHQAAQLTPAARAGLASELAEEASAFVSPMPAPPVEPERFLAGMAALRRDRDAATLRLESERMSRLAPLLTELPHGFPSR
jgi:uncharacterized RDD family membrane protein YckC